MRTLGENIKEARISRNLSQQALAELINSNQPQIARWESAKSMGIDNLALIAGALGLTIDNLLTGVWPASQACGRCGRLLVPSASMQLGMNPAAPFFCFDCIKNHTKECLKIKDMRISEMITAGTIRQTEGER